MDDFCCTQLVYPSSSNEVQSPSLSLSRKHATIELDDDGLCFLSDLGSVNGTKRNGLLLKSRIPYELRPGDQIQLGNLVGLFQLNPTELGNASPVSQLTQLPEDDSTLGRSHLQDIGNIETSSVSAKQTHDTTHPTTKPTQTTCESSQTPDDGMSNASSVLSSHLLADIIIDTEDVSPELMPNPSQYVSRSPSPVPLDNQSDSARSSRTGVAAPGGGGFSHCQTPNEVLLTDMIVCETPESPLDSPVVATCMEQIVAETEPFDEDAQPILTALPTIKSPTDQKKEKSNMTNTPKASTTPVLMHPNRLSFNIPTDVTKLNTASTPCNRTCLDSTNSLVVLTATLARDSDPGLRSNVDGSVESPSADSPSRCWDTLPETQLEEYAPLPSGVFVEESGLFGDVTSISNKGISIATPQISTNPSNRDLVTSNACSAVTSNTTKWVNQMPSDTTDPLELTQPMTSFDAVSALETECSQIVFLQLSQPKSPSMDGFSLTDERGKLRNADDLELTQPMKTNREKTLYQSASEVFRKPTSPDLDRLVPVEKPNDRIEKTSSEVDVVSDQFELTQPMMVDNDKSSSSRPTLNACPHPTSPTMDCLSLPDKTGLLKTLAANATLHPIDDDLFTQPMRVIEKHLLQALSSSFRNKKVDLDASQSSVECKQSLSTVAETSLSPNRGDKEASPTIDDLASGAFPRIKSPVSSNPIRQIQSATKADHRPHNRGTRNTVTDRVCSLQLPNTIGTVKFRSRVRTKQNCKLPITPPPSQSDSDNSLTDDRQQIHRLLGDQPMGLVRRASRCFTGPNRPTSPSLPRRRVNDSRPKSKRAGRMVPIPSPVKLPDSILSEDPSQLETSPWRRGAPPMEQTPQIMGLVIDGKSPMVSISPRVTVAIPGSPPVSAVALAGFDDSPQDSNKRSNSTPIVNLHSFSDLTGNTATESTHQSLRTSVASNHSIKRPAPSSRPAPRAKRLKRLDDAVSSPAKRLRISPESPPSAKPTDVNVARDKRRTRNSVPTKAHNEPVRRSRRLTTVTATTMTKVDVNPEECIMLVSRGRGRAKRTTEQAIKESPAIVAKTVRKSLSVSNKRKLSSSDSKPVHPITESVLIVDRCDEGSNKQSFQLLFSGLNVTAFDHTLVKIDATMTEDVSTATHLITDGWKRTLKMLYARARGIPIVSVQWLAACKRCRKDPYPDPMDYQFLPPSPESLSSGRKSRASHCRQPIEQSAFLSVWQLCCTPSVRPPSEVLAHITAIAGGSWLVTNQQIEAAAAAKSPRTVIITTSDEMQHRNAKNTTLSRSMKAAMMELPCVEADWFLQTVMQRTPPVWPVTGGLL